MKLTGDPLKQFVADLLAADPEAFAQLHSVVKEIAAAPDVEREPIPIRLSERGAAVFAGLGCRRSARTLSADRRGGSHRHARPHGRRQRHVARATSSSDPGDSDPGSRYAALVGGAA